MIGNRTMNTLLSQTYTMIGHKGSGGIGRVMNHGIYLRCRRGSTASRTVVPCWSVGRDQPNIICPTSQTHRLPRS